VKILGRIYYALFVVFGPGLCPARVVGSIRSGERKAMLPDLPAIALASLLGIVVGIILIGFPL
jgi:hypothetical protein